jgi:hypothetical protein
MKTIPIATSIAALVMRAAIAETRSSEYFVVYATWRAHRFNLSKNIALHSYK